jgi:hypothetical protein
VTVRLLPFSSLPLFRLATSDHLKRTATPPSQCQCLFHSAGLSLGENGIFQGHSLFPNSSKTMSKVAFAVLHTHTQRVQRFVSGRSGSHGVVTAVGWSQQGCNVPVETKVRVPQTACNLVEF